MARLNVPGVGIDAPSWGAGIWGQRLPAARSTFVNPLHPGADPWVVRRNGWYYFCQPGPDGRLEVWKSRSLLERGRRSVVWTPPRRGWNSDQVWAPELHFIRGRWYIYYAACDGRNATHRMGVLESVSDDPQGAYVDRGMLYTGDHAATGANNRWAIDGTVLEVQGQLHFIWSGWEDHRDLQHLYIAKMQDPCTISQDRVRLADNDCHPWERVDECRSQRGLHEGPAPLVRNGRVFLVYSCSGSWQPSYKLGMLHASEGADLANPASWTKHPAPVLQSTADVFGVGHCCFTTSPDGTEDWILYHAKTSRRRGWTDRVVHAQRFGWTADGFPEFGAPLPAGLEHDTPSSEWHLDVRPDHHEPHPSAGGDIPRSLVAAPGAAMV